MNHDFIILFLVLIVLNHGFNENNTQRTYIERVQLI